MSETYGDKTNQKHYFARIKAKKKVEGRKEDMVEGGVDGSGFAPQESLV